MVKISVLVAVYNAEKYLSQCLDSLLGQSLRDIQVICCDDASTDDSWQILQSYASRDYRVEIIHLDENGGPAKARNLALEGAKGEYVCFLDSDDWLGMDALEQVVGCFERHPDVDSVLFKCMFVFQDRKTMPNDEYRMEEYPMKSFQFLSGEQAFEMSLTWKIHGIYAVRTEIHRRFPYDESAHSYSDDNTTRLHYLASRKVGCCDGVYYYRQREDSVTHQVSIRRFDYLLANLNMKRCLLEMGVRERLIDVYENERWLNVIELYLFAKKHKADFSAKEYAYVLELIRKAWKSIESGRLFARNHYKLGYVAFHSLPSKLGWKLFLMEENLYYILRRI